MIELPWRSGSYCDSDCPWGMETFSKRTPADVFRCSQPEVVVARAWWGGVGSSECLEMWPLSLRDLTSLLKECWEGYEAVPQAASLGGKRGCPILRNSLSLSGENAATLSKGGPGFLEGPVQLEWFTPLSETSPQSVMVFSGLFWYGTT